MIEMQNIYPCLHTFVSERESSELGMVLEGLHTDWMVWHEPEWNNTFQFMTIDIQKLILKDQKIYRQIAKLGLQFWPQYSYPLIYAC